MSTGRKSIWIEETLNTVSDVPAVTARISPEQVAEIAARERMDTCETIPLDPVVSVDKGRPDDVSGNSFRRIAMRIPVEVAIFCGGWTLGFLCALLFVWAFRH